MRILAFLLALIAATTACSSNARRVCQTGPKGTQCYTVPDNGPPFPQ